MSIIAALVIIYILVQFLKKRNEVIRASKSSLYHDRSTSLENGRSLLRKSPQTFNRGNSLREDHTISLEVTMPASIINANLTTSLCRKNDIENDNSPNQQVVGELDELSDGELDASVIKPPSFLAGYSNFDYGASDDIDRQSQPLPAYK